MVADLNYWNGIKGSESQLMLIYFMLGRNNIKQLMGHFWSAEIGGDPMSGSVAENCMSN